MQEQAAEILRQASASSPLFPTVFAERIWRRQEKTRLHRRGFSLLEVRL
jgi:hypothetical protein